MSESNEPTATGPNAPTDRAAKARAAKAAKSVQRSAESLEIANLRAQIAEIAKQLAMQKPAEGTQELSVSEPEIARPGAYFVGGIDAATGKKIVLKRKWRRADVEREYPAVTFVPAFTAPIAPHGVKPPWQLTQGQLVTAPSIVKDIHDEAVRAIERQSAYRVSDEATRRVFDAAKNDPLRGRHFESLKHVGYGWPVEALQAVAQGKGDDPAAMENIGWEPEVGFPGGYNGKPLPEAK